MGRIKICLGVIIAIICLSVTGLWILDVKTGKVIELLDETQSYSDANETQKSLEAVGKLEDEWESYHTFASILVRNDKISSVQTSISRLRPLIEKENDELNAEFANARSNLQWIVESEIPRITNIF